MQVRELVAWRTSDVDTTDCPVVGLVLFNGHLTSANSDVRAGNNFTRHANRWTGLRNWWEGLLGLFDRAAGEDRR